jgi:DNA-binding MarR family transcriptional regulator
MDEVLKPYNLSYGIYPFLFELWGEEGINLEKLSRKIMVDKALSTRAIQKLIQLGYLEKVPDEQDLRAYRLFLTEAGRKVVPCVMDEIHQWNECITMDLNNEEKDLLNSFLDKILNRASQKKL